MEENKFKVGQMVDFWGNEWGFITRAIPDTPDGECYEVKSHAYGQRYNYNGVYAEELKATPFWKYMLRGAKAGKWWYFFGGVMVLAAIYVRPWPWFAGFIAVELGFILLGSCLQFRKLQ